MLIRATVPVVPGQVATGCRCGRETAPAPGAEGESGLLLCTRCTEPAGLCDCPVISGR